jgi:phage baseplate assembly protein W
MAENDPSFLGRGWHFPPVFDPSTGEVQMVRSEEDIVESLRILMGTRPGERIMQPAYGCRIHDMVFEIMDGETTSAIENAIAQAILFFEPRITLESVTINTENWIEGLLRIGLDYTVDETNSRSNMVFPFYIDEGTLVSDTPVLAI